jgi:hypothetical protein
MPPPLDANLKRLQVNRYQDLTTAEQPSMIEGAEKLRNERDEDEAFRIINASLDLEHFISVLPLDPAQIPQETLDDLRGQRDVLVAMIGREIRLHIFGERVTDKPSN